MPEAVAALLREAEGERLPDEEARARRLAFAERGPLIAESFFRDMGVSGAAAPDESAAPAEARERMAVERAREKGWLDE